MMNSTNGIYRLFGQHFFQWTMWWYDFILNDRNDWLFPYLYTGTNTYDGDGEYQAFFPVRVDCSWTARWGA